MWPVCIDMYICMFVYTHMQRVIVWLPSHTRYHGYGRATLLGDLCGMQTASQSDHPISVRHNLILVDNVDTV